MSEHIKPTSPDKILSDITRIVELQQEGHFSSAEIVRKDLVHQVRAKTRVDLDTRINEEKDL